ncbi:MAG: hypothetical protein LUG83_09535 [Lachnospiraceae bacterium]|nr:hypothetical protein [Lachnospiraceae bacterium]
MGMTAEEIKALSRTEEGIFDLKGIGDNIYAAASEIYPVYAAFETEKNRKEGYPDIMAQQRILNAKINSDFTFANVSFYTNMLLKTIENISQEIYENYRELLDMFRAVVRRTLAEYYDEKAECFNGDGEAADRFCAAVREACALDLLITEKYQMCF